MAHDLRAILRLALERKADPSAVIVDSRTLQSTPESGARAGFDGHKKRKGSKVHAVVDTLGHLLAVSVTPANEPDRFKGEDPIHRVGFAKPFAVGRFTISFDEWDACRADGGCGGIKGDDKGFGRGRMPAQGINFEAAKLYLAWLSRKVGRTYRLPSESEREYFTRAGTTTPFWFGNIITAQDANYRASIPYGSGPHGADSRGPVVVDSYAPNPFGLYQVHGNVFEWTEDCFNKRYSEDTPTDGSPWLEGDCHKRMLRGGTWDWSANMVRAGYRESAIVDGGGYSFRVVRTLNVQP